MNSPTVDEPLAESAPLALRLALTLCRKDPASGESCAWNHGPWQFLRLLGLALGPANNAGFYLGALQEVTKPGSTPRVLVSGAADYSMLAHVLAAMRPLECRAEVTVVDLCETPLELNRWYADRVGLRIRTWAGDVLEYRDERPYDLICTDNFLGRFTPERRPVLLRKWRDLLRPGGAVITVHRIRKPAGSRSAFTPEQAAVFRDVVRTGARSLRGATEFDLAELERLVHEYARHPGGIPVHGRDQFLEPFLQTGYAIARIVWGMVERGARTDVHGPRVPGGEFGQIIAVRR